MVGFLWTEGMILEIWPLPFRLAMALTTRVSTLEFYF
jgi:hypothetical protein